MPNDFPPWLFIKKYDLFLKISKTKAEVLNFENVNFSKKIRHPEFTDSFSPSVFPFAVTFAY